MHTGSLHSSHRIGPEVVGAGVQRKSLLLPLSRVKFRRKLLFPLLFPRRNERKKRTSIHAYLSPPCPSPLASPKKFFTGTFAACTALFTTQPFFFFLVFLISLPSNWFNPTSLSWSRKWLNRGLSRLLICLRLVLAGWVGLGRVGSDWGFRV
ncbi:hypothetical protein BKA61DRAFT_298786 [Leptodontidium sp. MPI-SDFR-AT-0119]|nr:hypothetical protein BKA61DRAFT_298786 [Leptodontidium sp. MPI-SDFR-AT-0119]